MTALKSAESWIDVNKPVNLPVYTAAQLVRDVYKKKHKHLAALKQRLSTRMVDSPEGAIWEEDLLQAEYELNPSYKAMSDRLAKMDEAVKELEAQKEKAEGKLQRVRLEGRLRSLLSQRLTVSRACLTMHSIVASAKADDEERAAKIDAQQKLADKLEGELGREVSPVKQLRLKFKISTAKRSKKALEKERDWLLKKDRQLGIENMYNKILQRALKIQKQRRFDQHERTNLAEDIATDEAALVQIGVVLSAAWKLERAGVAALSVPLMKKRDPETVFAAVMDAAGKIGQLDKPVDMAERTAIAQRQLEEAANIGADALVPEIEADIKAMFRQTRQKATAAPRR